MRVKDKVAVVTGGASGIGEATAHRLAEEGAKVAIMDINFKGAQKVASDVKKKGFECIALEADVSNKAAVQAAIKKVISQFGRIDILLNDAGVSIPMPTEQLTEEVWDKLIDVNLKGPFLCAQAVIPHMKRQKYGKIINIASRAALGGVTDRAHYCSSKAGVLGLTRFLAEELAGFNINVNAIGPGLIETPMTRGSLTPEQRRRMVETTPLHRIGVPQDIANAVLYFASDEASFVTGQCLFVCGGRSFSQAPLVTPP